MLVTCVPVAEQVFTWVVVLVVKAVQTVTGARVQTPLIFWPDWVKSPLRSEAWGTVADALARDSTIRCHSSETKKKVLFLPL